MATVCLMITIKHKTYSQKSPLVWCFTQKKKPLDAEVLYQSFWKCCCYTTLKNREYWKRVCLYAFVGYEVWLINAVLFWCLRCVVTKTVVYSTIRSDSISKIRHRNKREKVWQCRSWLVKIGHDAVSEGARDVGAESEEWVVLTVVVCVFCIWCLLSLMGIRSGRFGLWRAV